MNAPFSPIPSASDPIKQLSTRELLAAIIGLHEEEQRRGSLADAPKELLDRLEAGQQAARDGLDWLSGRRAAA